MADQAKSVEFDPPSEVWRVVYTQGSDPRFVEAWFGSQSALDTWLRERTWETMSGNGPMVEVRDVHRLAPGEEWEHFAWVVPQPTLKKVGS